MDRRMNRRFRIGVLFFLICIPACDQKEDVRYRGETAAETQIATKEVFGATDHENIPGDIDRFFEKMGKASRGTEKIEVEDFFSMDAMFQSLKSGGMLDSLDRSGIRGFKKGFESASNSFAIALRQMSFDKHRLLKLEVIDEDERLAYLRCYDNELNITTQTRWWLIRTQRGWRIYDFEDLSVGLRTVSLMGTMMSSGIATKPAPWIADFLPVATKMQTIDFSDVDSLMTLDEPLRKLRRNALPTDIRRFASALTVSMLQVKEDSEGSIAELEAALAGGYQSPLYHYQMGHALMQFEKYEEALDSFSKHAEILGWDSDVLESVSDCHYLLGNLKDARQAALDGLADNPSSLNCLCSLTVASSPEEIDSDQFRGLIDGCGDPAAGFELAFDHVIETALVPQAESMLGLMDDYLTDEDLISYYRESVDELKMSGTEK